MELIDKKLELLRLDAMLLNIESQIIENFAHTNLVKKR
jgi:hypothetical protein